VQARVRRTVLRALDRPGRSRTAKGQRSSRATEQKLICVRGIVEDSRGAGTSGGEVKWEDLGALATPQQTEQDKIRSFVPSEKKGKRGE